MTTDMSRTCGIASTTLALCALLLAAGCRSAEPPSTVADMMAGTWKARFDLGESEKLPFPTREKSVQGTLTLAAGPAAPADEPRPGTTRPVTAGSFAIDFAPLGFTLGGSQAIAWYGTAPTLSIILGPGLDQGSVAIAGTQKRDEITGSWTLLGDQVRATGTVVLTRGSGNTEAP